MTEETGLRTIRKEEIDYPDFEDNPRESTKLVADNPKIIGLSESIKVNGLKYPVRLYRAPWKELYGVEDGDRRLIACFDVLGWDEIPAMITEYDSKLDLRYAKLASNWARLDFSSIEKGKYCFKIIEEEMALDNLDIDENWGNREIRRKYMHKVSSILAQPISSISRSVNLYRQIPKEDRDFIAANPDELRKGKLATAKAAEILTIGRSLNDIIGTWKLYIPRKKIREKKLPVITSKELRITSKAIRDGQIVDIEQLQKFRETKPVDNWSTKNLLVLKTEEKAAASLAAYLKTEVSKVWRGAILVAGEHVEELKEVVNEL